MTSPLRQHRRRRAAENITSIAVAMLVIGATSIPAGFLFGLGIRVMVWIA